MDQLTEDDFAAWANQPITLMVRDYMLEEHETMRDLTESALFEDNVFGNGLSGLEQLGLEAAMRMAAIRGIEHFTNFDVLVDNLFPEPEKEEQKNEED